MGKLHSGGNWMIRVQGNEHPPIHVHVLHPDGRAAVYLNGRVVNNGVPGRVLRQAHSWIANHHDLIRDEWARMNNPAAR